jgi:AcrR family transcriptional regulator
MNQLRADAQRNLDRVLEAATGAFAERGPDVSVDEIARRAGVGHATVFRRFPTKDDLVRAVLEARVAEVAVLANEALDSDDPGGAFTAFAWTLMEINVRDRGLYECYDRCAKGESAKELEGLIWQIVERAQDAGAVRNDLGPADVTNLIGAAIRSAPSEHWRPYLEVVLDGLRPPASA